LSLNGYLKGVTTNSSPYTLLSGTMSIFIDNFFVSTAELKMTSPYERMDLYLGIDSAIKVDYVKTPQTQGSSGIINKKKNKLYAYTITVKNNKEETIKAVIMDQLPYTTDTKIKVTLQQPTLDEVTITDRNKLIRWDISIDSREEIKLPFSYLIEYPENKVIDLI